MNKVIFSFYNFHHGLRKYCLLTIAFLLIFTLAPTNPAYADDGDLDPLFANASGPDFQTWVVLVQPDGKILISGEFQEYNGVRRSNIARLNTDGSLDSSFDPGRGTDQKIIQMTLQPDGKILIGGSFTTYNGIVRYGIARINSDGSLDQSFTTGLRYRAASNIVVQPDGKILFSGVSQGGAVGNPIFERLNIDGSLDPTFNPSVHQSTIETFLVQPDGKIIIGGWFSNVGGVARNSIARLESDGSLDTSFNPGSGAEEKILSLFLQSDGKIIIVGNFDSYNGISRKKIARLNSDGSLDRSFDPGTATNGKIFSIGIQPDGKFLIGGDFNYYNGISRNMIARVNPDGSLDTSFDPGIGADRQVRSLALQSDGKVLIVGFFTDFNNSQRMYLARLNSDGSLDADFNRPTGTNDIIRAVVVQSDGKILIGGDFTEYGGVSRNHIARLESNGALDNSFDPGTGTNGPVYSIELQPDGKILIGGDFSLYNGVQCNMIARINSDGSLDISFDTGSGANRNIESINLQMDGKVLVAGAFTRFNNIGISYIARLLGETATPTPTPTPTPTTPPSQLPGTGFPPGMITKLPVQPSEKTYTDLGDLWLEIPRLSVLIPIVGVPLTEEGWDVSWLSNQAGWLNQTAFPSKAGNSALTAHTYDANGQPGPFSQLNILQFGDEIIVNAWGQDYIYAVRSVERVMPDAISSVLQHEEYPWLTLITCQGYDEGEKTYRYRLVVKAVQVKIF